MYWFKKSAIILNFVSNVGNSLGLFALSFDIADVDTEFVPKIK
jgi:hypothetical protein